MWTHMYYIGKELQLDCGYVSDQVFIPDYDNIIDIGDIHYSIDRVHVQPQQKRIKIFLEKI